MTDYKPGHITSEVMPTHRPKGDIEAWQFFGQPEEEWPDWLRAHYESAPHLKTRFRMGNWALRDDEGFFWRWLHPEIFERQYEPLPIVDGQSGSATK